MSDQNIQIALLRYPGSLNSAVYGLEEMFFLANEVCGMLDVPVSFEPEILSPDALKEKTRQPYSIAILTPTNQAEDYLNPDPGLIQWIKKQHKNGAIIASACCGSFILAQIGLLDGKKCTTHWRLEDQFRERFPHLELCIQDILNNEGDVITAGGMMSWLDLGFEIISQYSKASVLRELGRLMVIDTAPREQRFYQKFMPHFQHGDEIILELQHYLNTSYAQTISVATLASQVHLSERTLQRRFQNATGLNPARYIQRLRVQKACHLLETTRQPFESIAFGVGYQDAGTFRKLFTEEMGLSPKRFRERFA
ncbi:GlxA family transcriptional regulator [Vibrio quintilis]|uniref:HTH-type transcriptional regulator CdhR n=1 Tax=Vibrio quintilis TaxID=1117707 RepID=A0A1M7YWL2_9VIBR|nr:helix-turn-helix domain-containing protein [Vibrio quintilis]SHO56876.1 HTH-type transcriptional regulator CdhR [Vibrio quintilis]